MGEEAVEKAVPEIVQAPEGGTGSPPHDLVRAPFSAPKPPAKEPRSVVNARNATTHGYYGKEKRLTTELIESLMKKSYYDSLYGGPELICAEWCEDSHAFVDYVIAKHGPRLSRNQKLERVDESRKFAPGNTRGWMYHSPTMRKAQLRRARLDQPVALLLDCACDHVRQEQCARSRNPCAWAEASRADAPWAEQAEPPD